MSADPTRVLIVGAGHAGGSCGAILRQYGFTGQITVLGDEPVAPYQRPPLSKAYLKGDAGIDTLKLKPNTFYAQQNIDLRLGVTVTTIYAKEKRVSIAGGTDEPYDVLVLATGARARKLPVPGADLRNVHDLRTAADSDRLKAAIANGGHVAVVGGGYIGLEVAASARSLGARVTIVEREARVLARVACKELSSFFEAYHRAKGVDILTGASVTRLMGDANGAVHAIEVDGRILACDAAVIGVGAHAADELARAAGLACENGIVVDADARTSDPHIFAIGDVTRRPMPLYGHRMFRLESVPNALEQAKQAASAIVGRAAPAPEVPWFWSDQYDIKLQIAGVPFDAETIVVRGDPAKAKFAVFHASKGRILAVEAVNAIPEFMVGKQLIASGATVDPTRLADTTIAMKQMVEQQKAAS